MNTITMAENLIGQLSALDNVTIRPDKTSNFHLSERINVYVNDHKKKRWIKIDIKPESLHISLDHLGGSMNMEDIKSLNLPFEHARGRSGVKVTPEGNLFDAVHVVSHQSQPIDFSTKEFQLFLKKHQEAFLKRMNSY